MAAATIAHQLPSQGILKSQNVTIETAEVAEADDTVPLTVDHLIRLRARQAGADDHLVAYPSSGTDYVGYSAKDLDILVEQAACYYASIIPQRTHSSQPVLTIGLLGPSDLEYLVTFLAVTRLGHTALLLSTRISNEAYESLLTTTKATAFLYHESFAWAADFVRSKLPAVVSHQIRTIHEVSMSDMQPLQPSRLDLNREGSNLCFIIHSSGSTGLPKPIFQTHRACLYSYSQSFGLVSHITLPLYHNHGISCLFRAIYARRKIYIHNARLPLARQHLLATLKEHPDIRILYGVPYALKLLSETDEGMRLLSSLDIVMFGGSACPKPIGDRLVANGVHLVGHYGATEVGQLMTSFRNFDTDDGWDWLRVPDYLKPFLSMESRGADVFELVVKDGWKSKVATNREDGSYATKDLFEPSKTLPDTWRYLSRLDDTVTLENGEKVNPLVIEGIFRQHPEVAEAVVFGINKPNVGVFLIPPQASTLIPDKIIDAVWPMVSHMNETVPAWSRISKDMIFILPATTEYRRTDKGTVIRAAFYKDFAAQIEAAYSDEQSGSLVLPRTELLVFLRSILEEQIVLRSSTRLDDSTDLFSLGVDSLQAMQIRSRILRNIGLRGQKLGRNFVFDFPTLDLMAKEIMRLQGGQSEEVETSVEDRMTALIEKYSVFKQHQPADRPADGKYVVVTGATGSLGAHVVAQLVRQRSVRRVYCLVRADSMSSAKARVRRSLQARRLFHQLDIISQAKIVALPSSFHEVNLGLPEAQYADITDNVTHVLHLAWSVNFNKRLESFEGDCIAGLRNLINLALSARRSVPASFNFCSSVSATAATAGGCVPEALPASLGFAQNMGYAQSKHVAEHICHRASEQTGIKARVLRTGQIIGDSKHGIWNNTEAIPLMLQSALTIGALPALDETPSWLPIDTVASTCIEISFSAAGSGFMNVQNPKTFHWTRELLPLLRSSGLRFEEISQRDWVHRLRASNPDVVANPPVKLLDFFASKYDTEKPRRSLAYTTDAAQSYSLALQNAEIINQTLVSRIIAYLKTECWTRETTGSNHPVAIIIGGPCGTGKTTVAGAIADARSLPLIEGDDLHTQDCRRRMGEGSALDDADRQVWLTRIQGAIMDRIASSKSQGVVVTCSALKASYRDTLRALKDIAGIRAIFVMLTTGSSDVLKDRMAKRQGHYMKEEMVDNQVACLESAADDEADVAFLDAERELSEVLDDVQSILEDALV